MLLVNREDALRALQNSVLFSDAKSQAAGLIAVEGGSDGRLHFTATDDFVIIQDSIEFEGPSPDFFIDLASAKTWIKALQDDKLEDLPKIDFCPAPAEKSWSPEFEVGVNGMLTPTHFDEWIGESSAPKFAVRPSRFAKFSRLKLTDDYPIDFVYGSIFFKVGTDRFDRNVLRFKAGPTVHGILAPILRSTLAEEFSGEDVTW